MLQRCSYVTQAWRIETLAKKKKSMFKEKQNNIIMM
jgi:hypothetical protein